MTTRRAFLAAIAAALAGPKLLPAAAPGPWARLVEQVPAAPMHNLATFAPFRLYNYERRFDPARLPL